MDLTAYILLVHVFSAIWLIGGGIARQVTRAQLHTAGDIEIFIAMDNLAGRFETLMVRPGSLAVIASGLLLAISQGWPVFGFLQGASANWLLASNLLILSLILIIPLVFIPRGKVYEGIRQQALARGEITAELRRVLEDPIVRRAHQWEYFAGAAIIFLMVVKPF